MIEVILLERVEGLGPMGQVAKVKPGYARNYLLPKKKALRATKSNLEQFEKQRAQLEAKNATERSAAEKQAEKMENLSLTIIRQASEMGQLYGSVSPRDAAEAATEAGHKIERQQFVIDTPIKTIGLFSIKVKLHPEVIVKVVLNIARSPEEAVVQAQKEAAASKAAKKALDETTFEAPAEEAAEKSAEKAKSAKDKTEQTDAPKAKKPKAKKAEKAESEE